MSQDINFRQAAQAATFAVIAGAISPSSLLGIAVTTTTSIVAMFAIDKAGKFWDEWSHDLNARKHRVQNLNLYTHETEQDSMKAALERLKRHEKTYKWIQKVLYLDSDEKLLKWFNNQFKGGCCFGYTSNFLQKLDTGEQKAEDVYYIQMIQFLCNFLKLRITYLKEKMKSDFPNAAEYESQIKEFKQQLKSLKNEMILSYPIKSKKFDPSLSLEAYSAFFDEISRTAPNGLKGFVSLPKHCLGFQCSPEKGYLLYDPISTKWGGRLQYPDKESFIENLRALILRDLAVIKTIVNVKDDRIKLTLAPL